MQEPGHVAFVALALLTHTRTHGACANNKNAKLETRRPIENHVATSKKCFPFYRLTNRQLKRTRSALCVLCIRTVVELTHDVHTGTHTCGQIHAYKHIIELHDSTPEIVPCCRSILKHKTGREKMNTNAEKNQHRATLSTVCSPRRASTDDKSIDWAGPRQMLVRRV